MDLQERGNERFGPIFERETPVSTYINGIVEGRFRMGLTPKIPILADHFA